MAWIRNTSRHPDEEVRELVMFATRGVNMSHVCVNVKGARNSRWGRAYNGVPSISNAPSSAHYLITLHIGTADKFPTELKNYNGKRPDQVGPGNRYPFFALADWCEALVKVAAHEARHIHQFRHGKRHSEVDCERFSEKALKRYRESARGIYGD